MSNVLVQSAWCHLTHTSALRLAPTLLNGQSFGWRRKIDGSFSGVIGSRVVSLREVDDSVEFSEWCAPHADANANANAGAGAGAGVSSLLATLSDYFHLTTSMTPLVTSWSSGDPRFAAVASALPGMRILRQPPWECLVGFICSTNNNILRIGRMMENLRCAYGTVIGVTDDVGEVSETSSHSASGSASGASATASAISASNSTHALSASTLSFSSRTWYAFPTIIALGEASETDLRALGMGYRAVYIRKSALQLLALGGDSFFSSLRTQTSRIDVRTALVALSGVGAKVADCVALFSLDQTDAVPVDTHVWTIACRDLDPTLSEAKSITPAVYDRVGDLFRGRYGSHAGWAHSLLFAAELPVFAHLLPTHMRETMAAHRVLEKAAKVVKREKSKERERVKAEDRVLPVKVKVVGKGKGKGLSNEPQEPTELAEPVPALAPAPTPTPTPTPTLTPALLEKVTKAAKKPRKRVRSEQSGSSHNQEESTTNVPPALALAYTST